MKAVKKREKELALSGIKTYLKALTTKGHGVSTAVLTVEQIIQK